MARGGFLGRIGRAIRRVVAPPPSPPRPPKRPRPPEPPEDAPRYEYREVWQDHDGGRGFRRHLEVFHRMIDPIEDSPAERLAIWESYVKYMVKGEGRFRRNSSQNMFWRDSGLDPDDFQWDRWRDAMGYTGKRRSRTT